MTETRTAHFGLAAVLITFAVLGIIYSVVVPVWEKPDEIFHYFVIQHLLDEHSLPVQKGGTDNLWEQEGSQPPLYYLLAALAVTWVDTSDAKDLVYVNPQRNMGNPGDPGNKNFIIHTEREAWPYHGATLAIHIGRWLSLLFGVGTVATVFAIGRSVFPGRPLLALGAAAVTAFIPQFLFISSAVSNDSLVTLLSALALLQLVRLLNRPPGRETISYLLLGITVGLAALTKLSGIALLGLSELTLVWLGWQRRSWRPLLLGGLIVGGLTAGLTGWWFLRNLRLYGDLTGLGLMLEALGGRRDPFILTLASLKDELVGLRASFWGLFGWFGILMPDWVYAALDILALLAAIGLARWWRHGRPAARHALALLLAWLAIVLVSLVQWTLMIAASQGRLLFPALPGIALALALGWSQLFPGRERNGFPLVVAMGLLVLSAVVPIWIIAPAYARPPLLNTDQLPADLSRLEVTFGNQIMLHGCQLDCDYLLPGDTLSTTCYWEALEPINENYFVFNHLLGRDLRPVGKEHGYPGSGSYPTSLWPVGRIIASTEWLRVDAGAQVPVLGRMAVGVYRPQDELALTPMTADGTHLELVIAGQVKIAAPKRPEATPPNPVTFSVGDLTELVGYETGAGETIQVTLYWQATAAPPEDFTVLIHLLDPAGTLRGQGDGTPVNGDYPTSYWEPGEVIVDEHAVIMDPDAPPGRYRLAVGLYRPGDGTRLPVWDGDGVPQPNALILLPTEIELP